MSTYVFVHGAWHGAWCWYKVVSGLARAGHTVVAPDLPSLGRDKTPIADVSLAHWADCICQVIDAASDPVILVGHSRAGIVISEVAERRPTRVAALVYLTAVLLRDGEALLQVLQADGTSPLLPNLIVAADGLSTTLKQEALKEVLYGSSSDEDVALAQLLLVPEPMGPAMTPVHVTDARFGRVPRVYIECLRDNAIPVAFQRRMYSNLPCQKVLTLDADHSPFFSAPEALVEQLTTLSVAGAA